MIEPAISAKTWRWFAIACAALALLLAVLCVTLTRQLRSVQTHAGRLQDEVISLRAASSDVHVGGKVQDLTTINAQGVTATLRLTALDAPHLVILIGRDCPTCKETSPALARVATALRKYGCTVTTIDTESSSPAQLPTTLPPELAPVFVPQAGTTWLSQVPSLPTLVLVASAGEVKWIFHRAFGISEADAIADEALATLR